MIHYYTYYSVGGYKDMYLGSEAIKTERAYYLPLLDVEEKQANEENDATLKAKVERQKKLAHIGILTQSNNYGLPKAANTLVTHGSFSLVFTHLEGNKYIVVVRGLKAKDSVPFLLSLMCDSPGDLPRMNRLATYIASNADTAKKELAGCLHYDPKENGLCVELSQLNKWVDRVAVDQANDQLTTADGRSVRLTARKNRISLLLVPQGVTCDYALRELSMGQEADNAFSEQMILPNDNPKERLRRKELWAEEERLRKIRQIKYVAAGAVAILLIGGVVMMCTRS